MRTAPRLTALLVVVALLAAGIAPTLASAEDPRVRAVDGPDAARLDAPANTTIEVALYGNASADVTVTMRYVLESSDEREAFADYAAAYRAGETDAGPRVDPFVAAATTDREMRIKNVTRTGSENGATGSVSVRFRWTNFLTPSGNNTLVLEEALRVGDESTWLGSLTPDQTLVLRTPPGYSIVDSEGPSFDIRNNAVRFEGPREFGEPLSVTYRQTKPTEPDTPEQGVPWGVFGGGAVVLVLAAAAAYMRRERQGDGAPATGSPDEANGGATGETEPEPEPEPETGAEAETGLEPEKPDEPDVDPELLSDGERVERLLERNDGRMKQAAIVDETGWSDAKVSQLLSSMADENRIEKLRLGRENLISLPDSEE